MLHDRPSGISFVRHTNTAQFTQGKDGKFTGSVGTGKSAVPTPSSVPLMPSSESSTQEPIDYSALHRKFGEATLAGVVRDPDGFAGAGRPVTALTREDAVALLKEGDWVGYQTTDRHGDPIHVWVNEQTNALMSMKDGRLHRDDGEPALVAPDGTRVWFLNGKIHNSDGPAIVLPDGSSRFYHHGKCVGSKPASGFMVDFVEPAASKFWRWVMR